MPQRFYYDNISPAIKPVQKQLMLPLSLIFLFILLSISIVLYLFQNQSLKDFSNSAIQEAFQRISKQVQHVSQTLIAVQQNYIDNEVMQIALLNKDKDALSKLYTPTFQRLKKQFDVNHFYFHDIHRQVILRLHNPEFSGDTINRYSLRQAQKTGLAFTGLELGALGNFSLRSVVPVYAKNQLAGYIELGVGIESIIQPVEDEGQYGWIVLIDKEHLDRQTWQQGMLLQDKPHNWEQLSHSVVIDSSFKKTPSSWLRAIDKATHQSHALEQLPTLYGNSWQMGATPLIDVQGKTVGQLLHFVNITKTQADLQNKALLSIGLMTLFMFSLLGYLYFALYKIDSNIESKQQDLNFLAHNDILTGLANRQLFYERLTRAIAVAKRHDKLIAVLFLDLDNFKNINDSFGHSVGDELLIEVSKRLNSTIREEDTLARNGGDEFVIILENIQRPEIAATVANTILKAFQRPFYLTNMEVNTSTSIGISIYPNDGKTYDVLTRNADTAMYNAKRKGRSNFMFYTSNLTETAIERVTIENRLRKAVKNQEISLVYQPQFDYKEQKIIGVEALARWNDSELGFVSPAVFIPIAEEAGLIQELGQSVLTNACYQAKEWLDKGYLFGRVSVNIAELQLQSSNFLNLVDQLLFETGLPAKHLEFEVTESSLMTDMETAIKHLTHVKDKGITIAIDDFGTGYSSLSYLKKLPIQRLKIDKSFVDDAPDDLGDIAIINAIIAMAKNLFLDVIAEGVEKERQLLYLNDMGCSAIQGYYYSKPLPATEVKLLFEKKSPHIQKL